MDILTLPDLSLTNPEQVRLARRQIQSATLWLARFANSYVEHQEGNRHLRLQWVPKRQSFGTHKMGHNLTLELAPANLHLQFMENDQPVPHVLDLEDRTPAAAEAWMLVELLHRGIHRDKFSKSLPFDVPNTISGDSESYEPAQFQSELRKITDWFDFAVNVLSSFAAQRPVTDGVWIDPENLQALISVKAEGRASNGGSMMRIGFSLGDDRNPEPHFFCGAASHGTVQSLRPDSILTFSRIRKEALTEAQIVRFLRDAAGAKND